MLVSHLARCSLATMFLVNYRLLKGENFQIKVKVTDDYGAGKTFLSSYVCFARCAYSPGMLKIPSQMVYIRFESIKDRS